ncbi:MAG: MFS transporter [Flavobacteriaceae bacterium]|nr:MFS transporter [Flavobacteriaceae bacterium]|tara:strand:- start:1620 stop:2951 length:1332 start_codon:yes stop_codon:yes gene_type:complete
MKKYKKGSKKLLNAWVIYDWANSVYPLVISTAIFPIFYGMITDDYITFLGYSFKNTALISYITAFAFVILVFLSPLLSGIADYTGGKKFFMKFFCYSGSFACILLYWFDIDNLNSSLVYYFIALIGFWASLVFYNSYLPEIAYPEQQDKVSAKGYAMGYIGSVILLLVNLIMINYPEHFGIIDSNGVVAEIKAMKISFIMVGVWWFLFSQYTFYNLPGRKYYKQLRLNNNPSIENKNLIFSGFHELKVVWDELKNNQTLKVFLTAFFIYSIALQTVILVATYFGEAEISWNEGEKTFGLILSILLIQLIAVVGAILSAKISERIGNLRTLISLNIIWALICVFGYYVETSTEFYIAAGLVGLVMGGIQALSRSTFSKFIPSTINNTSYFSFYDVSQKLSIVIGMTLFATIDQITGSMRNSILVFFVFFVVGAIILVKLNKKIA